MVARASLRASERPFRVSGSSGMQTVEDVFCGIDPAGSKSARWRAANNESGAFPPQIERRAVSRFAHYLKAMMRDKIGSFMSRSECQTFLNRWIMNYVAGSDDVSSTIKAQRPLRDARIEVMEVPGKPGVYRAVAFLRPHFQLDELSVSLRLVAELPPAAK
jgi:type VI secretion system ImpC/EvpB family protein